jgi:hypothetical protein
LIITLVFSDSEFSFGVENAATIQTGVIISIIVFVVITGGVGSNMEGNMISTGNMLTKYAAGKSTITSISTAKSGDDKKVLEICTTYG